jgi:hypothetical protein
LLGKFAEFIDDFQEIFALKVIQKMAYLLCHRGIKKVKQKKYDIHEGKDSTKIYSKTIIHNLQKTSHSFGCSRIPYQHLVICQIFVYLTMIVPFFDTLNLDLTR